MSNYNSNPQSSSAGKSNQPLDMMQRDRFELLSAYMDGEVTADERRQVEEWLTHDPTTQRLYARLTKLRHGFQAMPVPTVTERSVEQTVNAVLARVERKSKLKLIWGGAAAAAVVIGAISGVLLNNRGPSPQLAQEPLMIALDKPVVTIPKTEFAVPADADQPVKLSPDQNVVQ